jgi:hypothetical protein
MMPMRSDTRRARQRLHHIEPAEFGDHHRHGQTAFQVGGVGAGRNHRVAALRGQPFADMPGRFVEAQVDRFDGRQAVVFQRDVAEQIRQARYRNRPDNRFVVGVEGQGRGMSHVSIIVQICFNVSS